MMDGDRSLTPREQEEAAAVARLASGRIPQPHPDAAKIRILWIFASLRAEGEETEVRLLAKSLDPAKYLVEVIQCFQKDSAPDLSHDKLRALGVHVDTTAFSLGFEDTVAYLRRRVIGADIVISSQDVADIYPAFEGLAVHPPLIERGEHVAEALAGPKHFTTRYVGTCDSIRAAAAGRMSVRPHHALEIPSMVDLSEFDSAMRLPVRRSLGIAADQILIGWVVRLDRKKRLEDFIRAAAEIARTEPRARFVVVGGPDASMPEYEAELHALARTLGLDACLTFTGDRADVPALLSAMDVFCWLSNDEAMPRVILEAGAASLAVIATRNDGTLQQNGDDETGIVVPCQDPSAVAAAIRRLIADPDLRLRLGIGLREHIRANFSVEVVVPQWRRLFSQVLAERAPAPTDSIFNSFVLGGWESSTHRLRNGTRLDVLASTAHDAHAEADYLQLAGLGIRACRDALRWHLIEPTPNSYDFNSFTPMLDAATRTGTQVIWDLMHYGWPDGLDIWSAGFVNRFAAFARACALHHRERSDAVPFWCPVNEISFFSWAGGDARYLNPFAAGRGYELKVQLARAAIAATSELRDVDPRARFVHAEPLIAVHHSPHTGRPRWEADGWHDAQFQAFDLISGRTWPQIGGDPSFLDIVGVNYYFNNQWIHAGPPIDVDDKSYAPLSDLLFQVAARYNRPILIAETGIEGDRRAAWFNYIADETARARLRGVQVEGICLYPIANHLGWDDARLCHNGLLGHEVINGHRTVHTPLADAVSRFSLPAGLVKRSA